MQFPLLGDTLAPLLPYLCRVSHRHRSLFSMPPMKRSKEQNLKSIWDASLIHEIISEKHASKMWHWLLKNPQVTSTSEIPFSSWSLSESAIKILQTDFSLFTTKVNSIFESNRGDTTKFLVELQDGHQIESVVMMHGNRNTVCVSSQVGCQMGCKFCATGTMGIIGDLSVGEIVEQLVHANKIAKIRNVVFMGMGEPLNNFTNVKKAVQVMIDNKVFGLSPRHVTVSTVGVVTTMRRLTDELPLVNLALSLHAPNQTVRAKIVPAATGAKIDKLLAAVDYHILMNCSRGGNQPEHRYRQGVMIEYILIRDVNDLEEHAHELGALLAPRRGNILLNLIPYNPTDVMESYEAPTAAGVARFHEICCSEPYNIHTRVRQEMGQDIAGACGQLALKKDVDGARAHQGTAQLQLQLQPPLDIEDPLSGGTGRTSRGRRISERDRGNLKPRKSESRSGDDDEEALESGRTAKQNRRDADALKGEISSHHNVHGVWKVIVPIAAFAVMAMLTTLARRPSNR